MTLKDLEYLAELSQFELSEQEKTAHLDALNEILEMAARLREADTQNVPPATHVLPLENVFREDAAISVLSREEALANAPEQDGGYFMVPRIL